MTFPWNKAKFLSVLLGYGGEWEETGMPTLSCTTWRFSWRQIFSVTQRIQLSCRERPTISLLSKDSESLLGMNKTQEASSLDLEIDPVFLFKYNVPLALVIFSPLQEAGNELGYIKIGRKLLKKEGSGQAQACSGLYRVWVRTQTGTVQRVPEVWLATKSRETGFSSWFSMRAKNFLFLFSLLWKIHI